MAPNRLFIWLLAGLAAAPMAHAEVQCPPTLDGHQYARASVFDGPPEEEADLIPDSTAGGTNVWQLDSIFSGGRDPYLVCRYNGTSKTVAFRLQKPLTSCVSPKAARTTTCR